MDAMLGHDVNLGRIQSTCNRIRRIDEAVFLAITRGPLKHIIKQLLIFQGGSNITSFMSARSHLHSDISAAVTYDFFWTALILSLVL